MKRFDPKHSGIDFGIGFEKFVQCAFMDIVATRQSDVRMPRA